MTPYRKNDDLLDKALDRIVAGECKEELVIPSFIDRLNVGDKVWEAGSRARKVGSKGEWKEFGSVFLIFPFYNSPNYIKKILCLRC